MIDWSCTGIDIDIDVDVDADNDNDDDDNDNDSDSDSDNVLKRRLRSLIHTTYRVDIYLDMQPSCSFLSHIDEQMSLDIF